MSILHRILFELLSVLQTTRHIPKGFKKKGRGVSVLLFDTGKEIFGVWIRQKSFSSAAIDTEISTCGQILIIINIVFNWITCKIKNKNKNNLNFLNFEIWCTFYPFYSEYPHKNHNWPNQVLVVTIPWAKFLNHYISLIKIF